MNVEVERNLCDNSQRGVKKETKEYKIKVNVMYK